MGVRAAQVAKESGTGFGLRVHGKNGTMHMNNRPVAQAIVAARQRKGWSQYRLAVHAGLHPNTVSLAERSGHFSERTAKRLAAALNVPVASLRCPGTSPAADAAMNVGQDGASGEGA